MSYFSVSPRHQRVMTTSAPVRNNAAVTSNETVWERLHRIAEARRKHLRLTQPGVHAAGGPSVAWQTKLSHKTEEPSARHIENLAKLDRALRWREGTAWGLITEDRADWSAEVLEDEETDLVSGQDRVALFAFMVEQRLRTLEPAAQEQMLRKIARTLGLPVIGD